ncbi:hypothetical protein AUP68_03414 [Ilyonectria robusta]
MIRSLLVVGVMAAGAMAQVDAAPAIVARCPPGVVDCHVWEHPAPADVPMPVLPPATVVECPPEVVDCPYRQHNCPPEGCKPPTEQKPPVIPPVVIVPPCEGCHHPKNWTNGHGCPPGGCGFIKVPVPCNGVNCKMPEMPECHGENCSMPPPECHGGDCKMPEMPECHGENCPMPPVVKVPTCTGDSCVTPPVKVPCTGEKCPPTSTHTETCPPGGCSTETPVVIVSAGSKAYSGSVVAAAAALAFAFSLI